MYLTFHWYNVYHDVYAKFKYQIEQVADSDATCRHFKASVLTPKIHYRDAPACYKMKQQQFSRPPSLKQQSPCKS